MWNIIGLCPAFHTMENLSFDRGLGISEGTINAVLCTESEKYTKKGDEISIAIFSDSTIRIQSNLGQYYR